MKALRQSCLLILLAGVAGATEFYVAPTGSSSGNGSINSPWDLQSALNQPAGVAPGDTIWLRGGVYGNGQTNYNSNLTGTSSSPIIVRQYPGEHAIVDGGITVNGSNAWFWGFEVRNSGQNRTTAYASPMGFMIFGPGTKLINLVLHDSGANEVFVSAPAQNSEIYGNLIYFNGWEENGGGHGHGIYTQNQYGTQVIRDNIIFDTFGIGIQAYGSSAAYVRGYDIDGNIIFNAGAMAGITSQRDNIIIAGGGTTKQDITVENNYTYHLISANSGYTRIGADWDTVNHNVIVRNNYFMGGYSPFELWYWDSVLFTNNTVYTKAGPFDMGLWLGAGQSTATYTWDNNAYYGPGTMRLNGGSQSWTNWKAATGVDKNSTYSTSDPTGVWTFIRPNRYEAGRANIAIYNWDLKSSVAVDVSSVLKSGTPYEIRDAENFFAQPIASGVYNGGTITIPMTGLTMAKPSGWSAPPHTAPQFGAFVLLPVGGTSTIPTPPPSDTTPPAVTMSSPLSGQTVSGTVAVSATASDNVGVAGVQFTLDGAALGPEDTAAPYSVNWDTTTVSNGSHTLSAVARDATGNRTTATSVTVTVSNQITPPPPPPPTSGVNPAAYWSFDSGTISGNQVLDQSGDNLNGTIYYATPVAGKFGQALNFDGRSYIVVNDYSLTQLTSNLTLTAWIRTTNTSQTEAILSKYDSAGTESGYLLKITPSGTLALQLGGANIVSGRQATDTKALNDGQWHQVAVVITLGQDVKFYVDGALSSTSPVVTKAGSTSEPFEIGALPFYYYGAPFTGAIDEVRVYRQALNSTDIAQLAGTSTTPTGDTLPPTVSISSPTPGQTVSGTITVSATASDNVGVAGVQFTLDGANLGSEDTTSPYTATWNTANIANGSHTLSAVARDAAGNHTTAASVTVTVNNQVTPPPTSSIPPSAYWSFDSGTISGNQVLDQSGNNLNGTIYYATPVAGKFGQALNFDGRSYIAVNDYSLTQLTSNLTLTAWIRTTNTSQSEAILSKYDSAGTESGYLLKITSSGTLALQVGGANIVSGRQATDTKALNDGQWHQVAVVITLGQDVKFYVDGALSSTSPVVTKAADTGVPFEIGALPFYYYGAPFTGAIDNVKLYRQALSATDISQLYVAP